MVSLTLYKKKQPDMWILIKKATERGLIVVDVENDAITATNRLLWTNPVLHDCLATLVDQWTIDHETEMESFSSLLEPTAQE